MHSFRAALFASLLCLCLALDLGKAQAQAETAPGVAVIALSDADRAVADRVEGLGVALTRRPFDEGATDVDLLLWARTLPEPLVLWVDSRTSTVSVLRTGDGTSLSRVLGQKTFAESPYVAALAATELLDLMRETPVTKVETPPVLPVAPPSSFAWGGSLGGELSAGLRGGPAMLRPTVGLDASLTIGRRALLYGELRAMPLGNRVESVRDESGRALVRYQRSDLALRLGAGVARGPASVVGYLAPGVGFLRVEAEGVDGDRARTSRRLQGLAGAGALVRYWINDHLGVSFTAEAAWLTSPARYLVDGKLALKEDPVRVAASLAILGRI